MNIILDFFLCVIWLPIGASKTFGLRTAKEVFTVTCEFSYHCLSMGTQKISDNGTGAPPAWNWILSLYVITF